MIEPQRKPDKDHDCQQYRTAPPIDPRLFHPIMRRKLIITCALCGEEWVEDNPDIYVTDEDVLDWLQDVTDD